MKFTSIPIFIRLYDGKIQHCEHIQFDGKQTNSDDWNDSEYNESLKIKCLVCNKEIEYTVCIN